MWYHSRYVLAIPRIGGTEHLWMNGLYDTVCCVVFSASGMVWSFEKAPVS